MQPIKSFCAQTAALFAAGVTMAWGVAISAVAQDTPGGAAAPRRVHAMIVNIDECRPQYPPESLQANETGTTTVRLRIATDGAVTDASVTRSSGHPRLDDTAVQALSRCRFSPGTLDGQAVESATTINYRWRIEPPKQLAPACAPQYPEQSLQANEQGTTVLRVWLSASGDVEKTEVEKSSGFPRLDRAAAVGLAACKFRIQPGPDGRVPASPVRVEYVWRLEDGPPAPQVRPWAPPTPDPYRPL
jgi:TonB family protein